MLFFNLGLSECTARIPTRLDRPARLDESENSEMLSRLRARGLTHVFSDDVGDPTTCPPSWPQ